MGKPSLSVEDRDGFRLITFQIPGGVCTPSEFAEAVNEVEAQLSGSKPVLINGRGPIWGYGMLIHAAHATPAIATFDPRLASYVVVATHDARFVIGQLIPDPQR
ncbi:MAG: CRISPR-associated ring nuclease Crn3/Csx3 [Dehalococcoidia bacterium]